MAASVDPSKVVSMDQVRSAAAKKRKKSKKFKPITVSKEDNLDYDLGNLLAFDANAIDQSVYSSNPEKYIQGLARDNVQLVVNKLFSMPSEPAPDGPGRIIDLPEGSLAVPREKPCPKPKERTVWEQFAARKGIQKKKQDKMVWDEDHKEWRPRYGYKRANDDLDQVVLDHKEGMAADPFAKMAADKKERVQKNNDKRKANLIKGSSSKSAVPGQIDLSSALHASSKNKTKGRRQQRQESKKQKQGHLDVALDVAQRSTGSMGRFDKTNRKLKEKSVEKRPQKRSRQEADLGEERSAQMGVFNKIFGKKAGVDESFNKQKATNLQQVEDEQRGGARRKSFKKRKR